MKQTENKEMRWLQKDIGMRFSSLKKVSARFLLERMQEKYLTMIMEIGTVHYSDQVLFRVC